MNLTLEILMQIINGFEISVTFAKLGILHKNIIKPTEINSQIETILKFYLPNQLIYTKY